jgi:hypothetical protein
MKSKNTLLVLTYPEDEGTTICRNISKYSLMKQHFPENWTFCIGLFLKLCRVKMRQKRLKPVCDDDQLCHFIITIATLVIDNYQLHLSYGMHTVTQLEEALN